MIRMMRERSGSEVIVVAASAAPVVIVAVAAAQPESGGRLGYHLGQHSRTTPRLRPDAAKVIVPQRDVRELHAHGAATKRERARARARGGGACADG